MEAAQGKYARLKPPPIRPDPFTEGPDDQRIVEMFSGLWTAQDMALRPRDRTIEEVIRMICNQQYITWSDRFQRFLDVNEYMTEEDLRWIPMPKLNRMLPWFMLTTSRMTENPPIWTTQPATADRIDAEQAEVWDVVLKSRYREMNMPSHVVRAIQWVVAAGRAHIKFRMDYRTGQMKPVTGPAMLSLDTPDGPIERYLDSAPYGDDGNPMVQPVDGSFEEFEQTGENMQREGALDAMVLTPFEARGEWNHARPWHKLAWHTHRSLISVAELYEMTGQEVQPDLSRADAEHGQELLRLLFGSGSYSQSMPFGFDASSISLPEDLVIVDEHWRAPSDCEGTAGGEDDNPGGRFTLYLPRQKKVLIDAERPINLPYTSPIHTLDFVSVPGRPSGTTPGEPLVPIQRGINRAAAQIIAHGDKMANPIEIVDRAGGLGNVKRTNRPGERLTMRMRQGIDPVSYVTPPPLGTDAFRGFDILNEEFDRLSGMRGQLGDAPTRDASGKLVTELRENSDRYYGDTARQNVEEIARMQETVMAFVKATWTEEQIIAYAGEDKIHRTLTAIPEMMKKARVNVVPDVTSMLPEGRGEKQEKVDKAYTMGAMGMPGSPQALSRYAELSKMPHPFRSYLPGEVHRIREQRELGQLLQGALAEEIPLYPWYDDMIAVEVFEEYMASDEFKRVPEDRQVQIVAHYQLHKDRFELAQMQAQQAAIEQAAMADAAGSAAGPPAPPGSAEAA